MLRKNTNENQIPLPLGVEPTTNRHDYGGQYDSGDIGHEFPFVQEVMHVSKDGVSVSLLDRAATLIDAGKMYAKYNSRTTGLAKAALIPEERAKLDQRYGAANVDGVVRGARNNSAYSATGGEIDFDNPSEELQMLEGVLKTKELIAAGFDPADVSAELQPLIVGIRHTIGTSVKNPDRQAALKKVNASANRAKKYSK